MIKYFMISLIGIILLIFYFYFKIIIVRNIFFNSESGEKLYESHINYIFSEYNGWASPSNTVK